jgi:hypothetical protein
LNFLAARVSAGARCTSCGGKGATLQHPGWAGNNVGFYPFPTEERALLAKLLKGSHLSIALNEDFEEDGASVYSAAWQLGCEGIVSKRLGSPYRSGRSSVWVKVKNPNAPAVKREAEEDWGSPRWIRSKHRTVVTRGASG